MHLPILLIFFLLMAPSHAQEIAITIDDVPVGDSRVYTGAERTRVLIDNLKKAGVADVLLYANTSRFNGETLKRIDAYRQAGFHIGNHSHSHYSPRRVELSVYLEDITTAHNILKVRAEFLPYYRYPFLHEGQDQPTRDAIRAHLDSLGYHSGYVTVDNYEWYLNALLQQALQAGQSVDYEKLKDAYVTLLWENIRFYDGIAREALGRSPKHVLLVHENDLTAMYIDDLVAFLRENGWKIISPQEAYQDPIAKMAPDVLFNNQGRVAAIAHEKGVARRDLVHPSEDEAWLDKWVAELGIFR